MNTVTSGTLNIYWLYNPCTINTWVELQLLLTCSRNTFFPIFRSYQTQYYTILCYAAMPVWKLCPNIFYSNFLHSFYFWWHIVIPSLCHLFKKSWKHYWLPAEPWMQQQHQCPRGVLSFGCSCCIFAYAFPCLCTQVTMNNKLTNWWLAPWWSAG